MEAMLQSVIASTNPGNMWSTGVHRGAAAASKKENAMSQYRRTGFALVLAGALSVPASTAGAQTQPPTQPQTQAPADNTKVNQRDRAKGAVTADQQKENAADRELTQKIRRALMNDKTLSSYAHNVKVVSQDGHVTLKGPVRTEAEKKTIEAKAAEAAGEGHVTSEISIAPVKSSKK
jgi:osmotically-inducible protein OsmY